MDQQKQSSEASSLNDTEKAKGQRVAESTVLVVQLFQILA